MAWPWAVVVLVLALTLLHANYWAARFLENVLERQQLIPLDEAEVLGLSREDLSPDSSWDPDEGEEDGDE